MNTAAAALDTTLRTDRGRLLAALIARTGDFQRAEDALQEAAASALVHWGRAGVPDRPAGWLLRAALRKAIDGYRKNVRAGRHAAEMAALAQEETDAPDIDAIPDERLRLIFTCCHPALAQKTQVALTLRALCGLTTAQVAAAFLDEEATMAQRLSRAKAKIAAARIPYAVPDGEDRAARLDPVLTVIFLVFTSGYGAGATVGRDLCEEAIFLARLLNRLAPGEAEAEGLLALLLLTHARAQARCDTTGATVPLAGQDRALWNAPMIAEGEAMLEMAMSRRRAGPFQIKAAIAALHAEQNTKTPDWRQIVLLYDALLMWEPTPVIRLNRAVALAESGHGTAALEQLRGLSDTLGGYQPFYAALADIESRFGTISAALDAYARAEALSSNPADRAFLVQRARNAKKKAETKLGQSPTGR